jgi:protein TonB
MKTRLLVLSLVAACCPTLAMSAGLASENSVAACLIEAGWMNITPVAPLAPVRVSAGSVVTYMVKPEYPREMRQAGMPGFVRLEVAVDNDGNVIEATVVEANAGAFAREALRAVGQWQFTPSENPAAGGRRIVRVPIQFALVLASG